ncbi:MAG: hypothetical protein ACON5K_11530 [Bacteroidia bacterium]
MIKQKSSYFTPRIIASIISLTLLFAGCSEKSQNEVVLPFEIRLESPDESNDFPEDTYRALQEFETECFEHTEQLFTELRERKIELFIDDYKAKIQIDEGDGLGAALSFGGALKNAVSDGITQMSSGLMNIDIKKGILKKAASLNGETKAKTEGLIKRIEEGCLFASRSKNFKLFYPKNVNQTKTTTSCIFETMGPLKNEKKFKTLLSHLKLVESMEEVEKEKNEFYREVFKMRYYLVRNHKDKMSEYLNVLKNNIDKEGFKVDTGSGVLDDALEGLNELILRNRNEKSEEVAEFLKFASEVSRKEYETYLNDTEKDILSFFSI